MLSENCYNAEHRNFIYKSDFTLNSPDDTLLAFKCVDKGVGFNMMKKML